MQDIHKWMQEIEDARRAKKRKNNFPRKYKDASLGLVVVQILPGDCYVSNDDEILSTVLGSCVSVCLQDPLLRIGGMNHFLLPESELDSLQEKEKNRYGQYAMEELLKAVMDMGADRNRLEAKIFGGGSMFASEQEVGQRNSKYAEAFLKESEIKVVSKDCGLCYSRKIRFSPDNGNVMVKRLPSLHSVVPPVAANDETPYSGFSDDAELFS